MKSSFKILIKNMVCPRCILTVETIFEELGISVKKIELGEVSLHQPLSSMQLQTVQDKLKAVGFEVIETRVNKIIEDIKLIAAAHLSKSSTENKIKLSSLISERILYDYSYVSDLFSGVEGKSIEQYFIELRIEKVKELIVYDQLSFTEIAFRTGFSSVHHLSAQFKKTTGLTPSHFKAIGASRRKSVDTI
jgi:AraC family transcriptional regulator